MHEKQELLANLPSVDEILKSQKGLEWLSRYPRKFVIRGIREAIDSRRKSIIENISSDLSLEELYKEIIKRIDFLSSYSLKHLINATGVVIHTNLGRSILSEKIIDNILKVSSGYSNLEYDIEKGKRGKRYTHIKRILREVTGAEDALVVNNNAAAVFLALNTIAKDKEVLVSRGELVEIGGSFRIPDVMKSSGAILREVGTTNKTHLFDYENAINENTALILKVHKSNYRITGFFDEVDIEALVKLGRKHNIPVMFDLGSGCLIDLKQYGIHDEPAVKDIVKKGVDLTTFSGDKLLGGPQGGVIVGSKFYIEKIQKNPITRAVRVDKLTLAGLEATLMEYVDEDRAVRNIPTLRMILQKPEEIKSRAKKLANKIRKCIKSAEIKIVSDVSRAGGGSLPELDFPTFAVYIKPFDITVNELEEKLRKGSPSIIARIKDDALLLDARTLNEKDFPDIISRLRSIVQ